jgi:diphthamide biosynthesis protein 7
MHAGTRVVRLSRCGDGWEFGVLAKFEEHKSMNYGSDVQPLLTGVGGDGGVEGGAEQQHEKRVIVSTSFYDKLMCVWRA